MASNVVRTVITGFLCVQITRATFVCPTLFDFYPDADDCTKFYRCFWGAAYPFHCPSGTKWNHKLLTCDFEYNVDCDGSSDIQDHSQTKQQETIPTESDYQYEGDHEYRKEEAHPWENEGYELYDEEHGRPGDDKHVSEDVGDHSPIHGMIPGLAEPGVDTATPQTPDTTLPSSTTGKSLIDYLYPDGIHGTPKEVADKERSDVTHDYAWYEGRDYNPDYAYDRKVDQDYGDYVYDYWRNNRGVEYGDDNTGEYQRGTTVPSQNLDYSYEVSYFQNGYPGFRHHYEPADFLSPAYARHNGPIGKRRK